MSLSYLFPDQQCDRRYPVCILIALGNGHLFEKLYFLLAGEEDDFGLTEDHNGVCQLIPKQPGLENRYECVREMCLYVVYMPFPTNYYVYNISSGS